MIFDGVLCYHQLNPQGSPDTNQVGCAMSWCGGMGGPPET